MILAARVFEVSGIKDFDFVSHWCLFLKYLKSYLQLMILQAPSLVKYSHKLTHKAV
jgi:hypothetical protein